MALAAGAEDLYYTPASTDTSTNNFGRFVYSSENWTNSAGVAKYPADLDILHVTKSSQMTATGASGYSATHVGGVIYHGVSTCMSQGELHMRAGYTGIILTNTTSTMNWYLGVGLYGTGEVPIYIHKGATWGLQRYFWQRDTGESTLVKRGEGTISFSDGSGYSSSERAKWKRTRLEAGIFRWYIHSTDGNKNETKLKLFPADHEFVFADTGTDAGATLSIGDRDLEMTNAILREASALAAPKHVITSATTTNVYVRLTGTPGLNPMGFGGKLTERAGLFWCPASSENVFVFSNGVSTTEGGLVIANGTVCLTNGASFTKLSLVRIGAGATFDVASGAGNAFAAKTLELADATSSVRVGLGLLSFGTVTRNGETLPAGIYTAGTCDWVHGSGFVKVGDSAVSDDWWTNDADHPKALADNVQTNWNGIHFSGESFELTAGTDASVLLGAGGADTAGAGATYTLGWPLVFTAQTLWKVAAGDTVTIPHDNLILGARTWYVDNATTGALRFEGTKTFPENMVVSNGYVEAYGDDSLGGVSGTTTFEMQSSSQRGSLRIRPLAGQTEISFHRSMTFHYYICGEWGNFMDLPEDCTVNFYGTMSTSSAGCKGNPWPCHWNYTCPRTTTVHWWGEMHAQLNHVFPGGTHYVHRALTGGDRFTVGTMATVELLAANNSIGAATGGMAGRLVCRVPYALDARNADRLLCLDGVLDLDGHDQALSILCKTSNGGVVTSAVSAVLHITRNQLVNASVRSSCTNCNSWVDAAGLSLERTATTYPLVLMNTSSTTGSLQVASGRLVLHAPNGKWPNASEAVVKGGEMVLEHSAALGTNTVVRFVQAAAGTYGKMELAAGARIRVASLEIDGVPQRWGTWGSSASSARYKNDTLFSGTGRLRVGGAVGSAFMLR